MSDPTMLSKILTVFVGERRSRDSPEQSGQLEECYGHGGFQKRTSQQNSQHSEHHFDYRHHLLHHSGWLGVQIYVVVGDEVDQLLGVHLEIFSKIVKSRLQKLSNHRLATSKIVKSLLNYREK
jgi:hypothetical protein